jgi:hypothetical protein
MAEVAKSKSKTTRWGPRRSDIVVSAVPAHALSDNASDISILLKQ